MPEEITGVTPEVSATSAAGDGGQPTVPQTVDAQGDSQPGGGDPNQPPQANVGSAAPPAAGGDVPENDDDLANLSETERTPLINQRNRIRELNRWKAEVEPTSSWVEQRGGLNYVQSDVQMIDRLFSENPDERTQFYKGLRQQDPAAFERFVTDIETDPWIQQRVLKAMDREALRQHVEEAGLFPANYAAVDPALINLIPQEHRELFKTFPPEVQAGYKEMTDAERRFWLDQAASVQANKNAEAQRVEREQQQRQERWQAYTQEQKGTVYKNVRSIVQQALTEKLPGSDEAIQFVLAATETALYASDEGAALWNELESYIDNGQVRQVNLKLPLLIAKAKAMATEKAKWLNDRESKARQFDELMRLAGQDEILAYVNKIRGGQRQPSPGTTPAQINGHTAPKPDLVGQYDPANIASYFPRS